MTLARREREKEARRQSILDSAERVMLSCGFEGMTMVAVANEAEVSKGTVYLYFDTKDALCAAIASRKMERSFSATMSNVDSAPTGLKAIEVMLFEHAKVFTHEPQHFRFMISWMLSTEIDDSSDSFGKYREQVGQMLGMVVNTLERGVRDGSIRADIRPFSQALQLWASFVGVLLFRHASEGISKRVSTPVDADDMLKVHVENVVRGLVATKEKK